ncbi:hypothetical protein [Paenibacillus silviterrae]|uniref:hypothetical protein n=1 Tax=Paenibacillus silviterrae TaxID=3242194 RepID=UPI002543D325|nr:hypothetical protein [Paenibacillus chinjuensis]
MGSMDETKGNREREDVQPHERLGLRRDDKHGMEADIDEHGAIQEDDRQGLWT